MPCPCMPMSGLTKKTTYFSIISIKDCVVKSSVSGKYLRSSGSPQSDSCFSHFLPGYLINLAFTLESPPLVNSSSRHKKAAIDVIHVIPLFHKEYHPYYYSAFGRISKAGQMPLRIGYYTVPSIREPCRQKRSENR